MNVSGSPEGGHNQTPPKKKRYQEEDESLVEDLTDEILSPILDRAAGCLIRPLVWIATLPIRLALKVIETIFD